MAQYISPDKRASILSSIKDDGMGIVNAAKKYAVSEKTIRKWLGKQTRNAHTSSAAFERLKRENQILKLMVAEEALSQRFKRKDPLLVS